MDQADAVLRALADIEARLSRLEALSYGGKAVFVGNNRVLTRANFHNLIYCVQADDRLIVPRFIMDGILEAEVTDFLMHHVTAESHCLDVGANFGYYACLMGRLAERGKTIALEPDEAVFELLRDNVYINWLESAVVPIHAAAAAEAGTLTLHRRLTRSGNTSIARIAPEDLAEQGERASEPFAVAAMPVDGLLPQFDGRVDFMKVDVEGAEPLVLRGARELIRRNPDVRIVMEWAPTQLEHARFDLASFATELAAMGLRAAILRLHAVEPVRWEDLPRQPYCNLLLTRAD